jgi:hypothetical protein
MSKSSPLHSGANFIFVVAFLYTLVLLFLAFFGGFAADSLSYLYGTIFVLYTLGLWISGILLYKRKRVGLILWYPLSVLVILNFPLGTIFGLLAYNNLLKKEVRELLQ